MNKRRKFVLLLLLLLLLVAVTIDPLIKAPRLCWWCTRRLVAAAHKRGCHSVAAARGRWWWTSLGTPRRWGRPPMLPLEDDGAAPWRSVEHGLGAAPWRMMTVGQSWPLLGEDGRYQLPPNDEDERGWWCLEMTVPRWVAVLPRPWSLAPLANSRGVRCFRGTWSWISICFTNSEISEDVSTSTRMGLRSTSSSSGN
jgi:hypothetical protein